MERLVRPFQEFAKLEASGGILLIGCTVAALVWVNSPWAGSYFHFWHMDLTFGRIGGLLAKPLHFWINDGLMALFFLLVGLELNGRYWSVSWLLFKEQYCPSQRRSAG